MLLIELICHHALLHLRMFECALKNVGMHK
jgi:hypothetical protein